MKSLSRLEIAKNIGAVISGSMLARLFSAITTIMIARQIGPDSFGQYSPILSYLTLTAIFFVLGVDEWLLRSKNRQTDYLSAIGSSALIIECGFGVLWFIAIWLITPFLNQDTFPLTLVILAAFSVWLEKLSRTIWNLFSTALKNEIAMPLQVLFYFLFLLMTSGLVLVGTRNIYDYLLARVIAFALGCTVSLWVMARSYRFAFDWAQLKHTLRDTIPFGMSTGFAVIYGRADITIIGQWMGKEAASQYAPASMLAITMFLVPAAVYTVASPLLSQAHASKGGKSVQQVSVKLIGGMALIGAIFGLIIMLIAHPLVRLVYGEAYATAGEVLAILSWVPALKFIGFATASILVAVGWQNRRVVIQAMTAFLNVGLTLFAVQSYGIIEVAYVYVLSEAFLTVGYLWLVWRWHRGQKRVEQELEEIKR